MDIRKISIGSNYKSDAMHYIVGQEVLGGKYTIHLIQYVQQSNSVKIWIQQNDEILLWKEFNSNMPVSIEYNINF
jgi:hypothetical protein|tara:strand:+ start:1806 stop:2030 length:225 start_codon:yes stop_codon:yes gene_type:complete